MSLTPVHRPVLADEVTARLRAMIQSGEWPMEERIPAEPELMARLSVSRGTLREAIKALAHSGMLEVRRGDGTYVRATSEMSGAARRMYKDHTPQHVLEVRLALDTQAARLAASNATAADIESMRSLLRAWREAWASGDVDTWARSDWAFHDLVAKASGNPLLHELYASFSGALHADLLVQRQRAGFNGVPGAGHEELVDALEARDAAAAVESVNRNLDSCAEWLGQ
ncbi:FadR/GntR family transcriptional regulator [Arthrobacter silvisoli]|uniref:FadR/GntR family transcriptional regulator n=1 Tax=Arthrobacter silvisoli TaxID=2291022 RepID=UPI000E2103CF|nr:FadR/GntR family transcriptional regulator [Arthrobacter silvisoli]